VRLKIANVEARDRLRARHAFPIRPARVKVEARFFALLRMGDSSERSAEEEQRGGAEYFLAYHLVRGKLSENFMNLRRQRRMLPRFCPKTQMLCIYSGSHL